MQSNRLNLEVDVNFQAIAHPDMCPSRAFLKILKGFLYLGISTFYVVISVDGTYWLFST